MRGMKRNEGDRIEKILTIRKRRNWETPESQTIWDNSLTFQGHPLASTMGKEVRRA